LEEDGKLNILSFSIIVDYLLNKQLKNYSQLSSRTACAASAPKNMLGVFKEKLGDLYQGNMFPRLSSYSGLGPKVFLAGSQKTTVFLEEEAMLKLDKRPICQVNVRIGWVKTIEYPGGWKQ